MQGIVVALEPDVEVTRHHISMALPFTKVGFTAHKWDTKNVSAYDMMDAVNAKLVICSHEEYYRNNGLSKYISTNGLNCLIRYEAEGDALGGVHGNCISYTRYQNNEFKECLPSCADIFNYSPTPHMNSNGYDISIKNYVNPSFFRTKRGESDIKTGIKIFRGYNLRNEFNLGDLPDADLALLVQMADKGFSYYTDQEVCITSDVYNILHSDIPCECLSDTQEHMQQLVMDAFGTNKTFLIKKHLPRDYTNFDRAIKISQLFNLGVEKDLQRESVKYK